jgi:hypothetical protein
MTELLMNIACARIRTVPISTAIYVFYANYNDLPRNPLKSQEGLIVDMLRSFFMWMYYRYFHRRLNSIDTAQIRRSTSKAQNFQSIDDATVEVSDV